MPPNPSFYSNPPESHLHSLYGTGTPEITPSRVFSTDPNHPIYLLTSTNPSDSIPAAPQSCLTNSHYPSSSSNISFFSAPASAFTNPSINKAFAPPPSPSFLNEINVSNLASVEDEWDLDLYGARFPKMMLKIDGERVREGRFPYVLEPGYGGDELGDVQRYEMMVKREDEREARGEVGGIMAPPRPRFSKGQEMKDGENQQAQHTYELNGIGSGFSSNDLAFPESFTNALFSGVGDEEKEDATTLTARTRMSAAPMVGSGTRQLNLDFEFPELIIPSPVAGPSPKPVPDLWHDFYQEHSATLSQIVEDIDNFLPDFGGVPDPMYHLYPPDPQPVSQEEESIMGVLDPDHVLTPEEVDLDALTPIQESPVDLSHIEEVKPEKGKRKRQSRVSVAENGTPTPAPRKPRLTKTKDSPVVKTEQIAPMLKPRDLSTTKTGGRQNTATPKAATPTPAVKMPTQKGDFEKLPDEVMGKIMTSLRFKEFSEVRLVNKKFKSYVESSEWWPKIGYIINADRVALREVITSTILDYFSIEVFEVFFGYQCVSCKKNANYIFIPMLCRVCPYCLLHDSTFDLINKATSEALYHFTAKQQREAAQAFILTHSKSLTRHCVLSRVWVKEAAIAKYGSEQALEADIVKQDAHKLALHEKRMVEYRRKNPEAGRGKAGKKGAKGVGKREGPRAPRLSKDFPKTLDRESKMNACVTVKFISPTNGYHVPGFKCKICRPKLEKGVEEGLGRFYGQVFTHESLNAHMVEYHRDSVDEEESEGDSMETL